MPLPNVQALALALLLHYCKRRAAEAEAGRLHHAAETRSLATAAEAARRLAAESEEARAAAVERQQRLAAAAAGRLASEAGARHESAAEELECLTAEAADTERLQAGLVLAAEAAADPASAHALRTAWLWLKRMEDRRYARREQEARHTPCRLRFARRLVLAQLG